MKWRVFDFIYWRTRYAWSHSLLPPVKAVMPMGKLELKCRSIVCCLRTYISRHQWPGVCAVERSGDFIANSIMAAINNNKSSRPIDGRERLIEFPSADSINSNRNDLHHRQYTLNTGRSKTMDDQRI